MMNVQESEEQFEDSLNWENEKDGSSDSDDNDDLGEAMHYFLKLLLRRFHHCKCQFWYTFLPRTTSSPGTKHGA